MQWWRRGGESDGAGPGHRALRAGLLLSGSATIAALYGAPAIANCTQNGNVVTCAAPGAGGFVAGAGIDGLAVTVMPNTTVIDNGTQGIGINSASSVVNNGSIVANTLASVGVLINGDGNLVINNNTLTVNAAQGFGIQSLGTGNTITNNLNINLTGTESIGISGGTSDTITNNRTINIQAGASQGIGILGFGGNGNVITNAATGLINVRADSSVGVMALTNNQSTNDGTILASGAGSFGMAVTTSTNNGLIVASGDAIGGGGGFSSAAMLVLGGTGTNAASGQLVASGLGAIGMGAAALLSPAAAINSGLIVASGTESLGMAGGSGFGPNAALTNNGTVIASGLDSVAVASNGSYVSVLRIPGFGPAPVVYGNADFTNNGLVRATGTNAFAIRTDNGGVLSVVNNGTIDGRIEIGVAGFGAANSLTNNGLLTTTTGPFAESVVVGDFTQTANGTYAPRVSPDTAADYDRFRVDQDPFGSVAPTLGGTLKAMVQPGLYGASQTYNNVFQYCTCSLDELTTRYANVISSSPFFSASVAYVDRLFADNLIDSVDLTLTRIGFGAVPGQTKNQQAVGNALESQYSPNLNPNSTAGQIFSNLLAATSVTVLDQFSGEGTAALQNASFQAGSLFNNASLGQLVFGDGSGAASVIVPPAQYAPTQKPRGHEAFAAFKAPAQPPVAQTGRWRIWTMGFGGYRSIDGEAFPTGSVSQSMRTYGGALGADYQLSPDLLLGFAAGGSDSSISVPGRSTTGSVTAGHFGLYGLKTWGAYYAAASASYARLDNSTTRAIAGIGAAETANGRFSSDQLSARFELGWKRAFASFNLTPFVAIEPAVLWSHGYTEASTTATGGPGILGLTFASRTNTSLPTFVGLQTDARIALPNGAIVSPYARLSWVHEFEPNRQINATFVSLPGASFTVDGARAASDAARLDAGTKVTLDATRSVFANLSGEWSGRSESYSASAGFRLIR